MKEGSTLFLKITLFVIAAGVLAICVFALPSGIQSEEAIYYRPILIGMYIGAVPFFIALYQAYKLLQYIDTNTAFSELSVKALQNIKYCGIAIGLLFAGGMPFIYRAAEYDDAPGVIVLGLLIAFASFIIAVFAAVLQKLFRNAITIKSENDLTV